MNGSVCSAGWVAGVTADWPLQVTEDEEVEQPRQEKQINTGEKNRVSVSSLFENQN